MKLLYPETKDATLSANTPRAFTRVRDCLVDFGKPVVPISISTVIAKQTGLSVNFVKDILKFYGDMFIEKDDQILEGDDLKGAVIAHILDKQDYSDWRVFFRVGQD